MDQQENLLQEKCLNKITNNHQKPGLKHQSSYGNIKTMAVRQQNQSQIFHKTTKTQFFQPVQTSQNRRRTGCEKENSQTITHVQQNNFMIQTQKVWQNPDKKHGNIPQVVAPNSARVRPENVSRIARTKLFAAQSLTRPASNTRNGSRYRNEKSRFNQTMKVPLDKKLGGTSSTQNLHAIKLQKCEDFLSAPHHHQSVQIPNDKYRSQVVSTFASQNRVDPNPIGPQKTKSQIQANQKKTDNQLELSLQDEDGPSEMEITHQDEMDPQNLPINQIDELRSTISSDTQKEPLLKKSVHDVFKERIQKWRKAQMKDMPLADQLDFRNPQCLSEFAQEIYDNMRKEEDSCMVDPDYLTKVQTEIKDTSRAFLIEWIIDVHRKFRLVPEALYVTQYIIDQYMSRKKIMKSQLHLLGVSTLLIAAKYEEIYPPEIRDFLAVSENKFTKQMVLDMEKEILLTLGFRVTAPSSYRFLQRFRRLSVALNDDEVFFYAQYLQEIALLDATLLKFKASELAAAAMILSAKQLKKINCWTKEMERQTGYTEEHLKEPVEEIKSFALEINPKFISTLRYKFSKPEYLQVAKHQFKF